MYNSCWEKCRPVNLLVAVREQLSACLEPDQQTVDLIMPHNRANLLKLWKMEIFHALIIFFPAALIRLNKSFKLLMSYLEITIIMVFCMIILLTSISLD